MLSLHAAIVLGLWIVLPSLTLVALAGGPNLPQSAEVFWRWEDKGDSDPSHHNIFTGTANATWVRSASCKKRMGSEIIHPRIRDSHVDVKAATINHSGDWMDPDSIYSWPHAQSSGFGVCNAYSRTDFWVHNRDRSRAMKIRFPDICTDKDCAGPDHERPNVQCLNGPKGRIVMYLDKWINECIDP
ncbi:uncharacterized protein MELLADRAFT_123236 [Melampsora larici-populina 98AG31]|uniref:Secreted protein n=1 Tax=Melampsora larici-populina (strain 98AG31 / pathotype 3-4-7) TaxID=747676 RepID=F4RT25_MELLP|nr:uncharacterized protein MELLADRAFT_123236 [Melampsora larici-populina 98AG31]EGG04432.1 secreted protein [Melampsora larici-populina 98AG31]